MATPKKQMVNINDVENLADPYPPTPIPFGWYRDFHLRHRIIGAVKRRNKKAHSLIRRELAREQLRAANGKPSRLLWAAPKGGGR